ncbi:MAG: hypothetical protein C4525_04560 [Desulfarculus sp.]|jgi:hypothetical protein|nr:MAG: hypothetical protein C4525_04560 [Desulfarculus sp.]
MRQLDAPELKELLLKCWMTHDGMWFLHCLQECGIEKTNRINLAAIRSLAQIEVKRVVQALGLPPANSPEGLRELADGMFNVAKGDFMDFAYHFTPTGTLRFDMKGCFAHDGMKRLGVLDQYQCGIFYRVQCWFDALGLKYRVTPEVTQCMMPAQGQCFREYEFSFPSPQAAS